METRKVQLTGGSSYVITLPKEWITTMNIKKNDPLGLQVQSDGSLLISAKTTEEPLSRTKELRVDDISDPEHLFRLLIGSYITGYSNIRIVSKHHIDPVVRDTVVRFTQIAIGPEIIEEELKEITTKDLLSPTEMPFDKTIRRMHVLVRSMHESAIIALKEGNRDLVDEIRARDSAVDRLHWLVARQSSMTLRDVTLAKKMGVTLEEANHFYVLSRTIERIGDHAVWIAKQLPVMMENKVKKEIVEQISEASAISISMFSDGLSAWLKHDMTLANKCIDLVPVITSSTERIIDSEHNVKGALATAVSYVAGSIRRTGEYSAGIAELAINRVCQN